VFQLGSRYMAGVYFMEISQGERVRSLKLLKTSK
jgi:hypothetical protein